MGRWRGSHVGAVLPGRRALSLLAAGGAGASQNKAVPREPEILFPPGIHWRGGVEAALHEARDPATAR